MAVSVSVRAPRRIRLACAAALLAAVAPAIGATAGMADCVRAIDAAVRDARTTLTQRFGRELRIETLRSEIAGEAAAVVRDRDRLRAAHDALVARRAGVRSDQAGVDATGEQMRAVDDEERKLTAQLAALESERSAVARRGAAHNATNREFRPGSPELEAFNEKAARIQADYDALTARITAVRAGIAAVQTRKADLEAGVGSAASRRTVLETTLRVLEQDEAQFAAACDRSLQRARAFAEIVRVVPTAFERERPADPAGVVLKGLGTELAVQAFKRIVYASQAPGITIAALDVMHAGADARTREVAKNILLIGDYALALKRLKQEGRLRPGDPSYDALRHMLGEIQRDMPASTAEFALQSATSVTALVDGLAAVAGHYAAHQVQHAGKAVMKHLSVMNKQVLGPSGYRFFREAIAGLAEAGASKTLEQLLKDSEHAVHEHLEEVRVRRLEK